MTKNTQHLKWEMARKDNKSEVMSVLKGFITIPALTRQDIRKKRSIGWKEKRKKEQKKEKKRRSAAA